MGVMIESNLVAGAQPLVPGQPLVYGQSITDGCIDWEETRTLCLSWPPPCEPDARNESC